MPLQNVLRNANKSLFGERPIVRPLRIEFLAVGGGAGGNKGTNFGNGGGAGGVITGSFCVQRDTTYDIIVGDGGAPTGSILGGSPPFSPATANKGEDTVLFGVNALGGGAAGSAADASNYSRMNGGSGGGINNGTTAGISLQPTASYSGFGNDGSSSIAVGGVGGAGGGGGFGSKAGAGETGPLANNHPQDAGYGDYSDFLNDYPLGNNKVFAQGGRGMQINLAGKVAPFDNTGSAETRFPTYGKGGDGGFTSQAGSVDALEPTSGSSGVVFVRYTGVPILQGGDSVVTNNGYTYHVFSTVGTGSLSFIPGKNQDNFAIDNCNDGQSVPIV